MIQAAFKNLSLAQKIFSNPQDYRNQFLQANLIKGDVNQFSGKSFICVSLTRFCPVGCKFCFFKSGPVFKKTTHEDLMTPKGMDKFIEFSNKINLGYLLVSGGGEPLMEKKSVLRILEEVDSERIVLVTSAHWAKTMESAERYLKEMKNALSKRKSETQVTVRVSVDSQHALTLGLTPILNLIHLFEETYSSLTSLDLQIHSLDGDPILDDLLEQLKNRYTITRQDVTDKVISDGKNALKVVPKQEIIHFNDLIVKVGYAKAFYSDLRVNIHDHLAVQRNIEVYQKDLFESEDGNSSIVTNKLGNPGLDFWVNYNGNVTTWGNQYLDNLFNLYIDSTEEVISGTLSDPAALSFIEKGANYRDRVVSEANMNAVVRSKAVNIRDYTGALMFDEARTRLYYTIRSLQDFINEGRISFQALEDLSPELQDILKLDQEALVLAYKESPYTIVEQTIEKGFQQDHVLDILEWIKLGHYDLQENSIEKLIEFYNKNVSMAEKILSLHDLNHDLKMQVVRMTEHLTHIKREALQLESMQESVA